MTLSPIDWIIIVAYLAGCTYAGLRMRRYVRNVDDFAVAAREVETSLGITSLAATEVGIVTVVYTAQMGFTNGPAGATFGVASAVAMLLVGITGFVIVPLRNARVMTIPELFQKRFGKRIRWLAGLVVVLGGVLNMGVFLRMGGEFLTHITRMDPQRAFHVGPVSLGYLELMMTALLAIVLAYTVFGGMLSVLITDYLQFLVKGTGIVLISVLVLWAMPWSDLISGLVTAHQQGAVYAKAAEEEAQRWKAAAEAIEKAEGPQAARDYLKAQAKNQGEQLENQSADLAKQWVLVAAKKGEPPSALTMAHPLNPFLSKGTGWVVWQILTALAVMTTWQTTISRVLAAKDAATAKRIYRGTWFYFAGRWALPGLWGAAAFVYFAQHGGLPANTSSETALPEFLALLLKPGLMGIVLAAMLAAEMSTDSGYLLTWATVIYNDLITPCLRRPMSDRTRLLTIRLLVLAIGLFLVFYGLWYQMPGNVWAYLQVTGNIYLASMFALLVGALYWRGANTWGALSAIVLGAAGPISYLVANAIAGKEVVPDWLAGLAAFGLAFAGMFVGSLLGRTMGQIGTEAAGMETAAVIEVEGSAP